MKNGEMGATCSTRGRNDFKGLVGKPGGGREGERESTKPHARTISEIIFPGLKRPKCEADHPPPSSEELHYCSLISLYCGA
jgi:hypothetical protein